MRIAAAAAAFPLIALSTPHAGIDGTIDISVHSPTLKHWGVPAAQAAFVPDADQSAEANAIRRAASADARCAAIERAARSDTAIATASFDGDGDLAHRSGDEVRLSFEIDLPNLEAATPGMVCFCSQPIVAVVSRGGYPNERFEPSRGHRVSSSGQRLTLRPGTRAHVQWSASIDASDW